MEIGSVQSVDIDQQMREAYLDYAMSVIISRALPDARDGLKPVHRRILYAMHDMGIRANTPYKKSARIVGEVLGKYHPHGDSAVYDAMVRLAQDFSMRYMLVDGQGNFGSIDGDAAAAMRYTEARLASQAEEMLSDIDKDTVNFGPNFDGSLEEPLVLPSRLPNLLLNGSSGIAVGMATNVPPHNLREVAAAIHYLIEHYEAIDEVTVEDLMHFIPGPDFPTGGIIIGAEGIVQAYGAGRGKLTLRGMAQIDEMNGNRHRIIITEIPYQLNKTSLIERIAELAREGRLDDVSDMRDESDRRGMRITIELKRGAQPKKVLNQLYKYTPLQGTYGVQMLALVDGEPRLLSLKKALQHFIEHRREVIRRRSTFELNKARDRAHILAGLLIALAHLDDVINTIRQSPDADVAKTRLMERFNLSERQAQAILDMQLRRLAALERQKIEDEQRQILERIAYLEDLLANPQKILGVIDEDITHLAEKYGDGRRTKITQEAGTELRIEDLVVDEPVLVSLTQRGYVKRMPASALRAQGRGSKGVAGHATREEDAVAMVIPARTLHTILFFTDKGKVYAEKAYQIPAADRTGRGIPIVNVLSLEAGETVTAAVAVREFDESHFAIMATRQGRIKRVALGEFAAVRPSGVIAINLDQGDRLGWVAASNGKNEIILVTQRGRALRFDETEVRAMGRSAAGVNAMRLSSGDALAGMDIVENDGYLLVLTERGYGKRTPLSEYPAKGRAGGGLLTINQDALEKVGLIVAAPVVQEGDDLTIMTGGGQVMRTAVKGIAVQGRSTRGVSVMKVGASSRVASVARVARADVEKVVKAAKAEAGDGNGNGNGSGEIESPGDLVE